MGIAHIVGFPSFSYAVPTDPKPPPTPAHTPALMPSVYRTSQTASCFRSVRAYDERDGDVAQHQLEQGVCCSYYDVRRNVGGPFNVHYARINVSV